MIGEKRRSFRRAVLFVSPRRSAERVGERTRPPLIHLDHRLVGSRSAATAFALAFANGAKVEAEFVIGADGVRSVIRQALYGSDNPPIPGKWSGARS
jgi:2-polyprenyl-6-methoxyphenol hydroxylase-like FAD-dependent oxidoreductase